MKRLIVLFTIVSFLSFGDSFAQINNGGFSLLVNITTPIGKFGEVMGIRTGLGFGIEYTYPIDAPGISWITSASLLSNGNSAYLKSNIYKTLGGTFFDPGGPVTEGPYYNIPILTGFKFHGDVPHKISGYGMIQIGLNFIKPPSYSGEHYLGGTYETSFDFAKSFGFGIGGGLVFFDKFNVGIRFYNFGEAKIISKTKYDGKIEAMNEYKKSLSMLLVTFGIQL